MKNNRDIQIYLLLSVKINEPNIINKIITNVKKEEDKDILDYHNELWEKIACGYFNSIDRSPFTGSRNFYSYVLDGNKYIYEKDRVLTYYNETKIPFQCRELLLDVIKNDMFQFYPEKYIDNIGGECKNVRADNDKLYSPLSELIMGCMKDS